MSSIFFLSALYLSQVPATVSIEAVVAKLATASNEPVVAISTTQKFPRELLRQPHRELVEGLAQIGWVYEEGLLLPRAWPEVLFTQRATRPPTERDFNFDKASSGDVLKIPLSGAWRRGKVVAARFHTFYDYGEIVVSSGFRFDSAADINKIERVLGSDWNEEEKLFDVSPAVWKDRTLALAQDPPAWWTQDSVRLLKVTLPEWSSDEVKRLLGNMEAGASVSAIGKPITQRYVLRALAYFLDFRASRSGLTPEFIQTLQERAYLDGTFVVGFRADLSSGGVRFRARPQGAEFSFTPIPPPAEWRQGG